MTYFVIVELTLESFCLFDYLSAQSRSAMGWNAKVDIVVFIRSDATDRSGNTVEERRNAGRLTSGKRPFCILGPLFTREDLEILLKLIKGVEEVA